MKLEGEIWELELIPQLVELGSQAFTGAIRFENDSVIKIVYFKEGNVLSASTNDRADSIDEILLKSGKVTRDHVKQALSRRKETETLGDALLGLGFIAKRELAWARRVQLIGILRSISEWKSGSFTVVADYLPKREEGTSFPLPQVVLELVLTDQDRAKYEKLLESGAAVYVKAASFDDAFASLGLNQEAAAIVARIDGVLSAAELASESGSDAFNVYKLLNALNLLGIVERTEKSLEVSGLRGPAVGSFESPAPPTMEMSLDFGGSGGSPEAASSFRSVTSGSETSLPRFESESSVPAEDLMAYDDKAPAPDESEDLGIDYAEPAARSGSVALKGGGSEQDGLGSIEALRNFEVPATHFPPIEDRIAQKQQQKGKPLTSPAARGRRKTGIVAAAAIAGVAIVAAAGWYYFLRSEPVEEPVAAARSETRSTPTTTPEPQASTTEASTAASAAGTTTTTVATETAPAETSTAESAVPAPVVTTNRSAQSKPVEPPAGVSPKPVSQPPASVSAPSSSKFATQAQKYVKEAPGVPFTVQFELVCRDVSVEKAISAGGSKIWFVPISYRGQQCYRVFWGRYANRADAERAVSEIPASLRSGKPSVISPGATP